MAPIDLAFGPDGDLYVILGVAGQVLATTDRPGPSSASLPVAFDAQGLMFGRTGACTSATRTRNEVLRYKDGTLSAFVAAGSGGLLRPRRAVFGPDGNGDGITDLYVASRGANGVYRYDGLTGAFIDIFAATPAGLPGPFPT